MLEESAPRIPSKTAVDESLVRAAQSGNVKAFSTLVEQNQGLARAIAFSVSSDHSISEDLAQEAMVSAWLRLSDLEDVTKFRPWLASIVRNTARYWRRHQGRHAPRAQYGLEVLELLPDSDHSPLELALHKEDQSHAKDALEGLPTRYKEPLLLYYCLGESHAEVASALGVSEAAVRQRLCRARKKLKQEVSSVERASSRLRNQASAAASVLLLIHSRQVWAHTAVRVSPQATLASPKLFMGLGALAGGAMVACVAAIVFLVGGNAPSAATHAPAPTQGQTASFTDDQAAEATRRGGSERVSPHPEQLSVEDSRALVRIGSGRVKEKDEGRRGIGSASLVANAESGTPGDASSDIENAAKAGRIHKHGPAKVEEGPLPSEVKPMLRPTLDMRAVHRERWSED